ncbi:MAG TPA: hypothetical protein VJQ52_01105 [Steroidobacteraceae bacterium]|nr:hypothetical protein [Steroidobacteraceae bacterium]
MRWKLKLSSVAMFALCACGGSQAPSQPAAAAQPPPSSPGEAAAGDAPANPAFIGRVWRSTERGGPLGKILVFLPDRTLLMDSCFETYRVSKWGVAGTHIRWLEDTIPIEAEVVTPGPDELILRIEGQDRDQTYIAMTDPYTCPDMPR